MLTFRRALLTAFIVVTLFLLLRKTRHEPTDTGVRQPETPFGGDGSLAGKHVPAGPSANEAKAPSATGTIQPGLAGSRTQSILSDISKKPLRQQLAYYFPYEPKEKFPAYIWQTWKDTPASTRFPQEWRAFEASWSDLHPGFVHEVITDSVAVHVLRHLYSPVPDVIAAYNALPHAVLKADFFRYLILLARGGIYADIDTAAIKSVIDWVPASVPRTSYGLVIGIEADPDRDDWRDWYARRIQFCQWTIQAKPGHPVLREMVARLTESTLRRQREGTLAGFDLKNTVEYTGPAAWTDEVFSYFNNPDYFDMSGSSGNISWQSFTHIEQPKKVGDVVVLPITSFSPGIQQMGAKEPDDPMAYVLHNFEGSWKPESERHMGEKAQAKLKAEQEELERQQKEMEAKQQQQQGQPAQQQDQQQQQDDKQQQAQQQQQQQQQNQQPAAQKQEQQQQAAPQGQQ